jgi:hypothetical protein
MADTAPIPALTELYESDFHAWTRQQAQCLRDLARAGILPPGLDADRLAEEIEDLGKRDRRAAMSAIENIIAHLAKRQWSRNPEPRRKWAIEVLAFRRDFARIIADSPALLGQVAAGLEALHVRALADVEREFAFHEPDTPTNTSLRWTLPQILGEADDPLDAPPLDA